MSLTTEPRRPIAPSRDAPQPGAPAVPPLAPGALPVLGHAPALLRDPLGFLGSLSRHGGVVRIRLGPRTVYVVTDARLVHALLVARAHDCPRGAVQDTLRTAFGDGLLMSEGQAHRDRRRVVQPAFGQDRMAGYLAVMHQVTEERAAHWRPGQVLDVAREMNHLALEIVTRTLFDARLSEDATLAFHRALPDLVKGQIVQSLYPHPALARLPLPVNRRFDAAVRVLNQVVDQAVDQASERGARPAGCPFGGEEQPGRNPAHTLPALLRAATDPATGRPLTEADVRSEAITMFGAGTETVSTTLTWLIDELLRHPRVEALVLAELDEHLPAGTVPTPEALARLTYTHSVTREVVRLHAPNAFLMRTASVPVELGRYRIPAGTELLYSLTALHRDPLLHPDPLRFHPGRWHEGGGSAGTGPRAFLPFGAGKHKCIGEAFAWAELTVAAAAILRRWRPTAVPGARAREVVWTTVQAQGLRVRLTPREAPGAAARPEARAGTAQADPASPGSAQAGITPATPAPTGTAEAHPLQADPTPTGTTRAAVERATAERPAAASAGTAGAPRIAAVPRPAAPAHPAPRPPATAGRLPGELLTATTRHADWALRHGLLRPAELPRYQAYALPGLIGHAYPRARGAELDLLVDVLGWFTILDDRFDGPPGHRPAQARAVVHPLLAVLTGDVPAPAAGDSPLLHSWRELWERQCDAMSPVWRGRSAAEWRSCLETFLTESAHRAGRTSPGLTETLRLRRHASCLYPFMNILERVHGADAPARLYADPALHRLRAHTADAATLINDLYSLEREERQAAAAFNTVLTLQRVRGCTRTQAAAEVRHRVARLREESDTLRRRLLLRHPAGHWYLNGTRELVDGVQAWTSTSRRYVGDGPRAGDGPRVSDDQCLEDGQRLGDGHPLSDGLRD
ncbi:cytochrome P450 [Kitasatospora sp. RG8]|uniref:cytochrome P450 n=1 Tax=Kitasatospora sp. RG8 TaxID=2820815 RepID=UPI001AE0E67E|nr:cytochrome P450 [Kitasatospora sp. RG8]MBP0449376.1 cytochrome P450 [Kitasatospora sp. RG8]